MGILILRSSGAGGGGFTPDSGWSTSGTMADNQDVVVTKGAGGLGFTSDPRPRMWIPGNSINADATYSRDTTSFTLQQNAAIDSSIRPTNSASSIRQGWPISLNEQSFWNEEPLMTFTTGKALLLCKRYYEFDPNDPTDTHTVSGTYNDKIYRIWPAAFGQRDLYHKYEGGNSVCCIEADTADSVFMSSGQQIFTGNFAISTWLSYEHIFQENSSLNALDGIHRYYLNGARSHPESIGWMTRSTSQPNTKTQLYANQISNADTNTDLASNNLHQYMADAYVDDKLQFFVISTESSWTQVTQNGSNDPAVYREPQLPRNSTGSDTQCGLRLRKGAYASIVGKYLWFWPPDGSAPQRVGQFT